jgi:hypothetical protein
MINQQATTPTRDRECRPNAPLVVIRARTVYGDLSHVVGSLCEFHTYLSTVDSGVTEIAWRPSAELRRAFEHLPLRLAPHQAPPPPPSPTVTPQ